MPSELSPQEQEVYALLQRGRHCYVADMLLVVRPDLFTAGLCNVPLRIGQQIVGAVIARINRKLKAAKDRRRVKPGKPRRSYILQRIP